MKNYLAAAALASIMGHAYAHLKMVSPPQFVDSAGDPVANLDISGINYPCMIEDPSTITVGTATQMKVGDVQPLGLSGSASHGGGSCQLSLSKDAMPTRDSEFKVIKSFIGNCPTTACGNGGVDAFNFTIPAEVPDGQYTFAWTWFNAVGNREMYMRCAPVEVVGSAGTDDTFSSLPDIYVVHLNTTAIPNVDFHAYDVCQIPENEAIVFPNPGQYVQMTKLGCAAEKFAVDVEGCGQAPASLAQLAGADGLGAGLPTSPAVLLSTAPAATTPAATTPASSSPPSASTPAPARSASAPASSPNLGSTAGDATCDTNGAVLCNGEDQFGICNWGRVVWEPVATGTRCVSGVILKKRDVGRDYRRGVGYTLRHHHRHV